MFLMSPDPSIRTAHTVHTFTSDAYLSNDLGVALLHLAFRININLYPLFFSFIHGVSLRCAQCDDGEEKECGIH